MRFSLNFFHLNFYETCFINILVNNHIYIHNVFISVLFLLGIFIYLNFTAACHTKANAKNSKGIIGNTSIIGSKGAYASGKRAKVFEYVTIS